MFLLYFNFIDILIFSLISIPGIFLIYKGYKNGRYALAGCTYLISDIVSYFLIGKPSVNGWVYTLLISWFILYLGYSLVNMVIESREISGKRRKIKYQKVLGD